MKPSIVLSRTNKDPGNVSEKLSVLTPSPHCPQAFLTKLLTVDLPGLMVLPKRLEINIPPALTAVAEAAVGRDSVMRAVASAVLQVSAAKIPMLHDRKECTRLP